MLKYPVAPLTVALIFLAILGRASEALGGAATSPLPIESLYRTTCAPCHGIRGDGKGPVARYLNPRPRDFTLGQFLIRSTKNGEAATDSDLFHVIRHGMPGTSMPAWPLLTDDETLALARHVQRFSEFRDEGEPAMIDTGDRVPSSPESIDRGRQVYVEMGCVKCHGETGNGSGVSAEDLKLPDGTPVPPNDLTQGWDYKGGNTAEQIYLRLFAGLDGTPMPSSADALITDEELIDIGWRIEDGEEVSENERHRYELAMSAAREEIWHLSNYVASLAKTPSFFQELFMRDSEVTR